MEGGTFNGLLSNPIVATLDNQNIINGTDLYSCITRCPLENSCQSGGVCTSSTNVLVFCQCPVGFEGTRCSDEITAYTLSTKSSLGIQLVEELISIRLQMLPLTTSGIVLDYPGTIRVR